MADDNLDYTDFLNLMAQRLADGQINNPDPTAMAQLNKLVSGPTPEQAGDAAYNMTGIPNMQQGVEALQRGEYLPGLGQTAYGAAQMGSLGYPLARAGMAAGRMVGEAAPAMARGLMDMLPQAAAKAQPLEDAITPTYAGRASRYSGLNSNDNVNPTRNLTDFTFGPYPQSKLRFFQDAYESPTNDNPQLSVAPNQPPIPPLGLGAQARGDATLGHMQAMNENYGRLLGIVPNELNRKNFPNPYSDLEARLAFLQKLFERIK